MVVNFLPYLIKSLSGVDGGERGGGRRVEENICGGAVMEEVRGGRGGEACGRKRRNTW